ncbi:MULTISPECIES: M18 family aminopeptidase [unclassified Luteococcus]|uniref:M18 family aminopeptidase n=1 Tax=unclassified Luteococcus TaxID=2639923 RepID=UPI00313BE174
MPSDAALDFIGTFADFISASPTSYHAVATMAEQLRGAGFTELDEKQPWDSVGNAQFTIRDGALIAWLVPDALTDTSGFRIVGSHTDSPSFKLKPNPTSNSAGWQQCGMEVYGGPLNNSWLDRELGLAGRLVTIDGTVTLVRTGPIARIPQLAPHLDRTVNDNLHLDRQQHLMPFYSLDPTLDIEEYLCRVARIDVSELAHHDVLAFPTEAPAVFGPDEEFFASSRMDNLSSVYASLQALLDVAPGDDVVVLAAFDHEEVGSSTRSGACGPFLEDVLVRLASGLGVEGADYRAMLARSSCLSADAGHAVHPNYVHMHDPNNHPQLNAGPLLKINGNQRYATDGSGGALWKRACEQADVPTQAFVGSNAVPCGSTIGPLTATRLGILTVDVGIPLLSMHSARELCGVEDPWFLKRALEAYWAGA